MTPTRKRRTHAEVARSSIQARFQAAIDRLEAKKASQAVALDLAIEAIRAEALAAAAESADEDEPEDNGADETREP